MTAVVIAPVLLLYCKTVTRSFVGLGIGDLSMAEKAEMRELDGSDCSLLCAPESAKSNSMCSCQRDSSQLKDGPLVSQYSAGRDCRDGWDQGSTDCKTCCLLSLVRTVHAVRSSRSRNWADAVNHASSATANSFSNSSGTPSTFMAGAPARGIARNAAGLSGMT